MNLAEHKRFHLITAMNIFHRSIRKSIVRWYALFVIYALFALLAFPILEMCVLGKNAPQYTLDIFDDGAVSRLGAIAADWHQFGLTLWNPYLTAGNPLLSQFVMSPFSVDVLLSLVVSPFTAYGLTYYLIVLVAGFSMHVFLRDSIELPKIACLVGGIIYMFNFWPYNFSFAVSLFPLMLLLFERADFPSQNRRKYLIACVVLIAFLFYSSHTQVMLLMAGVQLSYIVFCISSRSRILIRLREWIYVWVLGILLYAPVLITQLVFLPDSHRAIWDLTVANPESLTPFKSLVSLYSSITFGIPVFRGMGKSPGYHGTYYMGVVGLPILIVSLLTPRKSRKQWFFLICLVVIPLFDLLALTLLQQAQEHLGFLRSFNLTRVRHFMPFALAANVAIGVSCLQNIRWNELTTGLVRKGLWVLLSLVIALQGLASARIFFYVVRPFDTFSSVSDLPSLAMLSGWTLSLVYAMTGVIIWLFVVFKGKRTLGYGLDDVEAAPAGSSLRMKFLYILLILVCVDRLIYARIERFIDYNFIGTFQTSLETTPALSFLKNQPNPQTHRTLTFNDPDHPRTDHPNKMMFHRLYAADGYENIYPLRYHELFGLLTAPYLAKNPSRYQYFHGWGNRAYAFGPGVNMALANLMGIRWFYARNVKLDNPQLVEVFNAGDERVYENLTVFPRAFIVNDVRAFSTRGELLDGLFHATSEELRAQAYVLENDVSGVNLPNVLKVSSGTALITDYEPDQVTVDVATASPAILALTDVNAPGWICTINGDDTRIFFVDNAFRGVMVPTGHSQVTFKYVPRYTYAGVGLSLLAVVVTGLWYTILGRRTV